jgi:hypothetical protein
LEEVKKVKSGAPKLSMRRGCFSSVVNREMETLLLCGVPLLPSDFDGPVRQKLHAIYGIGGDEALQNAMEDVYTSARSKHRKAAGNWRAWINTILKRFLRELKQRRHGKLLTAEDQFEHVSHIGEGRLVLSTVPQAPMLQPMFRDTIMPLSGVPLIDLPVMPWKPQGHFHYAHVQDASGSANMQDKDGEYMCKIPSWTSTDLGSNASSDNQDNMEAEGLPKEHEKDDTDLLDNVQLQSDYFSDKEQISSMDDFDEWLYHDDDEDDVVVLTSASDCESLPVDSEEDEFVLVQLAR